ncbi:MAG: hypothetical protein V4549_09485 [Bacteroidota bacterium]
MKTIVLKGNKKDAVNWKIVALVGAVGCHFMKNMPTLLLPFKLKANAWAKAKSRFFPPHRILFVIWIYEMAFI